MRRWLRNWPLWLHWAVIAALLAGGFTLIVRYVPDACTARWRGSVYPYRRVGLQCQVLVPGAGWVPDDQVVITAQ